MSMQCINESALENILLTILTNKPELVTASCIIVQTHDELVGGGILIACCTGVIVKSEALASYSAAYNIHPAPPSYPGRDPHHWAFYESAESYGVTMHVMTEKVDDGEVLNVDSFPITQKSPMELKDEANRRAFMMLNNVVGDIGTGELQISTQRQEWTGQKRKRKDLIEMCCFKGLSDEEIELRKFSFQGFEDFFEY
jgi:methionyl-tRNA formyltransferase